jgi:hypothetical protein
MAQKKPEDVLYSFVNAVHDSLIAPLKANQVKLSWQRELRESKRFQEAENKLNDYFDAYKRVKDNLMLRDKVLEILRTIHATRMTQFLERGKEMSPEECGELRATLSAYLDLLPPVDDVRRLQNTMLGQGKLKKMSLPYEEITATLGEVTALAARMPKILMDGVSDLSDALEKAA